jgi:hypothetical protein
MVLSASVLRSLLAVVGLSVLWMVVPVVPRAPRRVFQPLRGLVVASADICGSPTKWSAR